MSSTPRHETADITFLKRDPLYETEKPFVFLMNVPESSEDKRQTNILHETIAVPIHDVRGDEDHYSLDEHGFAFRKDPLKYTGSYDDEAEIEQHYLPAARQVLLREVKDAEEVFVFDWRIRTADYIPRDLDMSSRTEWLPPASNVHIDQSPLRVLQILESAKVRDNIDAEKLQQYLHGRVRIVNLWRPVSGPVQDMPLAYCDGRTVQASDLYPHDVIRSYGHRIREAMAVAYSKSQKWYYLSSQCPDEVLLLKCFDSKENVPAMWSPHTAFRHTNVPKDAIPRKSIEVRALVFTSPIDAATG